MAETNTLDILCDDDSANRANELWATVKDRSETEEDVEATGDLGDHWALSYFTWKSFSGSTMQPFDGNQGPERWTVPDMPHVEIRYEVSPYEEAIAHGPDAATEGLTKELIEFAKFAYAGTDETPRFLYGVTGLHEEHLAGNELPPPITTESLADDGINYSTWLMVFPPAAVDTYGRETLLSAPAWHIEELDDGAVLTVSTPEPLGDGETGATDEHLGVDRPEETENVVY